MTKLLIATPSNVCSNSLKKLLDEKWDVLVCTDGYAVVDTLKYLKPEAMVLELSMPKKDGLSILEECFPNIPPATLALSPLINEYVAQTCFNLGVKYVMRTPCRIEDICKRVEEMYLALQEFPSATMQHLRVLGVRTHLDGYRFLLVAIPYFKEDPNRFLHKEIYPYVMTVCNTSSTESVEHSIRSAIRSAWKRKDSSVWASYFPECDKSHAKCPSNRRFISILAERI